MKPEQPAASQDAAPAKATASPVAAQNANRISVDLQAKEKTWVSVTSEGKTVFRGLLAASQTKTMELAENAQLLTGNAAGLDVRANGKPLGPLGPRGQVRVVVFNTEKVQIFAPRKM